MTAGPKPAARSDDLAVGRRLLLAEADGLAAVADAIDDTFVRVLDAMQKATGRVVVSGRKKPCSLSRSMDLLTASVEGPAAGDEPAQLAIALIPRGTPGLRVEPFWGRFVLAGALVGLTLADAVAGGLQLWPGRHIRLPWVFADVWLRGMALAALVGCAVGALPSIRAMRLRVAEALAGR